MAKPKMRVLGSAETAVRLKPSKNYDPGRFWTGEASPADNYRKRRVQALTRSPVKQRSGTTLQSWYLTDRNLTPLQNYTLYMKTPDIRAAVDAIVRRVATWDWNVEPTVEPSSGDYEKQAVVAEEAKKFLQMPNENRQAGARAHFGHLLRLGGTNRAGFRRSHDRFYGQPAFILQTFPQFSLSNRRSADGNHHK